MLRAIVFGIALMLGAGANAQEVLAPNPDIEATIQRQFDAFAAGDVAEAFTYASPNIQRMFRSAENFGRMVEGGYPMVWSPGEVSFIDLQSLGATLVQRVQVIDQFGTVHVLGYAMIETDFGWMINGVQILEAAQIGV